MKSLRSVMTVCGLVGLIGALVLAWGCHTSSHRGTDEDVRARQVVLDDTAAQETGGLIGTSESGPVLGDIPILGQTGAAQLPDHQREQAEWREEPFSTQSQSQAFVPPARMSGPGQVAGRFYSSPSPTAARAQADMQAGLRSQMRSAPGAMPSVEEEIWVIQLPEGPVSAPDPKIPGCGAMLCAPDGVLTDDIEALVPVPLKHTDVKAFIGGVVASTVVRQSFENPYSSKIEAVYVFPLPQNAAVNEFVMTIGERRIRGILREREEAERVYREARSTGHVASLLTQERANVFTQRVANIEPGKAIDVEIAYLHTMAYRDGSLEYVFPMVVGPRFNPSSVGAEGIAAVPRGADSGASGMNTEVAYLAPNERSGHEVSVEVTIDAGVEIARVRSVHHQVAVRRTGETSTVVRLDDVDRIPNRDFVLKLDLGGETMQSGVLAWSDPETGVGYFTAMIVPPSDLGSLERRAMELVFVIDCSGSMRGVAFAQAQQALLRGLELLRPGDSFQVIRFAHSASTLGSGPLEVNRDNLERARQYVNGLQASGGTQMLAGIQAALGYEHDADRQRYVVFLTDGFIGNESEVLGAMRGLMGRSRVFSMGVGSSPNRFLMERMAKMGRGAAAFLSARDDASAVMDLFFETVSRPAMTNVVLEIPGASAVYPSEAQDVFVGRPVVITGRYNASEGLPGTVRVRGETMHGPVDMEASVRMVGEDRLGAGLRTVWARNAIADLMDRSLVEAMPELPERVRRIALDHSLMSAFTAFVAVDSSRITEGDSGTTVLVPVHVPEGVRYETTVPPGR